jgi:anti-sigma B factor antagonist
VGDGFRVELSRRDGFLIASVLGEIDLATAPKLLDTVESDLASNSGRTSRVVIDLTEVEFLDSSGLNALVRLERLLTADGTELRLVSPTDAVVRQVFEITQLTETLRVAASLDEALRC